MSKRKPVLPELNMTTAMFPWTGATDTKARVEAELRAAEAVIREARRLPGAAWKLSTFQTLRRALARLDKVTGRDKR